MTEFLTRCKAYETELRLTMADRSIFSFKYFISKESYGIFKNRYTNFSSYLLLLVGWGMEEE